MRSFSLNSKDWKLIWNLKQDPVKSPKYKIHKRNTVNNVATRIKCTNILVV